MRRICRELVGALDLPAGADLEQAFSSLCAVLERRTGREVRRHLVCFPPGTVSGLWVGTDEVDHILCEIRASPWHRLLILCHEIWHIETEAVAHSEHRAGVPPVAASALFEGLDAAGLARVVAARSHYDAETEREADMFATLLVARLVDWAPSAEPEAGTGPDSVVGRLVRTLDAPVARRPHG